MKNGREIRTSVRHFKLFKREVLRLVRLWHIDGWSLRFLHEKLDSRAELRCQYPGMVAAFSLSTVWAIADGNGDEYYAPTDENIVSCARHETIHLLTQPIVYLARERYVSESEITASIESLARKLQFIMFEDGKLD